MVKGDKQVKDSELSLLTNWRYSNIRTGEKIPYPNNWPANPLKLEQIQSKNIGVILGPASGICAIDWDGEEAIDFWTNQFNIDIASIDTVMWTSGKHYRLQAAFTINQEFWPVLKRKVVSKLEFRWGGCQSILPPSKLNDGREYFWIKPPSKYPVRALPEQVLEYWLNMILEDTTRNMVTDIQPEQKTQYSEWALDYMLSKIAQQVNDLKGDYDTWRTIAWALCSQVGTQRAKNMMMKYWPYKTQHEQKTLNQWRRGVKGPGLGTLIKMSGITRTEREWLELKSLQEQKKTIDKTQRDMYK